MRWGEWRSGCGDKSVDSKGLDNPMIEIAGTLKITYHIRKFVLLLRGHVKINHLICCPEHLLENSCYIFYPNHPHRYYREDGNITESTAIFVLHHQNLRKTKTTEKGIGTGINNGETYRTGRTK